MDLQQWLTRLEAGHPKAIDLGLGRVGQVFQALGRPAPAVTLISVAGTNGKGSTVAYLDALIRAHGYRCGTYTSPHLLRYNERVQINGKAVSDSQLVQAFEQVEAARAHISLSYFEFGTLAAFCLLAQAELEFCVLEVGLGGRLDAVNLIDAHCAVITPIGLDHQDYLGPDRESIGFEKAGIFRRGQVLAIGDRQPPASVLQQAVECGLDPTILGQNYDWQADSGGITVETGTASWQLSETTLRGRHQRDNFATALVALSCLKQFELSAELVDQALRGMRLPGRLQRLQADPDVYVDVGHNAHAAQAISAYFQTRLQGGKLFCILAMLADKDVAAVGAALQSLVQRWFCVPSSGPRGQSANELAGRLGKLTNTPVETADSVKQALTAVLCQCGKGDTILIFGSFLTAAEALQEFNEPSQID